jgi:transmembrane sensor
MPRDAKQSAAVARQAAWEWVMRHDRGLTGAEQQAFVRWRDASPDHAAEFEQAAMAWTRLGRIRAVPRLQAAADGVLRHARARRRFKLLGSGLLAAAAAVALAYVGLRLPARTAMVAPNYQVLASTAREVRLPDGSTVLLNGDSRIETTYTETERRVWLRQGEALFTVAKNPARPFFVTAGPVTVRAVGTAFTVQRDAAAVQVLVTEGRVRVDDSTTGGSLLPPADDAPGDAAVLQAGQRAVVGLAGTPAPAVVTAVVPYEMEQAVAWQSTHLVFRDTPLDEVVAAFNHYNAHQLALEAPELRERKITGVFRADNVAGFVRLLEAGAGVKTEARSPRETVLRPSR